MDSTVETSCKSEAKKEKRSWQFYTGITLGGLLLLVILMYLLAPIFAKSIIKSKMNKVATAHQWEITVQKMKVSHYKLRKGFTCSFQDMLVRDAASQDSLVYMNQLQANVALRLKHGMHAQVHQVQSDYAFLSFMSKKDTTHKTEHKGEKDYPKTLNKMMQLFTEFCPEQLSSHRIEVKTIVEQTLVSYQIDSLTIQSDSLQGTCTQVVGDTLIRWQISGQMEPENDIYSGCFSLIENKCDDKVRLLKGKFNTTFLCDKLTFGLQKLKSEKGTAQVLLKGKAENAYIENPKLAEDAVLIENASFNFNVNISDRSIMVDSSSTATLNGLTVHPFLRYEKQKQAHITMSVKEKDINAKTFFNALPKELFTVASKLKVGGKMDFSVLFDCDFAHVDDLKFDFSLKGHGLSFDDETMAYFAKYSSSFEYPCFDGDTLSRNIIIGPEGSSFCSFERIPKFLTCAILASEDASFFRHRGFIKTSIRDAMVTNIKNHRFVRGGSTISMQLVKNLFLNRKKHFSRKLEEMLLVWLIEDHQLISKERMFEIYVNIAEWAPCVVGITEAANFYFDKQPEQLNFGECVYLATLIRAPKQYAYTLNNVGEVTNARRSEMRFVAQRMLDREMITEAEHAQFNSYVATNITEEKIEAAKSLYTEVKEKKKK